MKLDQAAFPNYNKVILLPQLLTRILLFCIQHLPCSVSFWCVLGCSVEVYPRNIVKLILAFQEVLKMNMALNEQK